MRANKHALFWTTGITLVSLIIAWFLHERTNSFMYDISLACFGSALLAVVVAYAAYNAERREAMEQFWNGTLEIINTLKKIPHFELREPMDLVRDALTEESSWFCKEHEKRNELYDWIEQQLPIDVKASNMDIERMLSSKHESILEKAKEQLMKSIDALVSFSDFDLSRISNAYGQMDFVFGNDSIRLDAYTKLYDKIRCFMIKCKEESQHLKLLQRGAGHIGVCFDKVVELDKVLYKTKAVSMGVEVYAFMVDELLHDLETFRSKIYHIEPEYEEPLPVLMYIDFEKTNEMMEIEL